MPGELVYINEMQDRIETAAARFFELYKAKATVTPAAFPLTRTLSDWLDDFSEFLDVASVKRTALAEAVSEAAIAGMDSVAADAAADRTGELIEFADRKR